MGYLFDVEQVENLLDAIESRILNQFNKRFNMDADCDGCLEISQAFEDYKGVVRAKHFDKPVPKIKIKKKHLRLVK